MNDSRLPGQIVMIKAKSHAFKPEEQKLIVIFSSILLTTPLVVMLFATAFTRM